VASSLPRPPQELKGFDKVLLAPGETRPFTIPLGADAFAFHDPAKRAWVAEAGEFEIRVGSSPRLIRLEAPFTLKSTVAVTR
jgi:beta-glucosidase